MTNDRRNRTIKLRKSQNSWSEGNLKIIGNIGSRHHQTSGGEGKKFKKNTPEERKNYTETNYMAEILLRDKYLGCPPRKILGTILKVEEGKTSTNGPMNKKTHDDA